MQFNSSMAFRRALGARDVYVQPLPGGRRHAGEVSPWWIRPWPWNSITGDDRWSAPPVAPINRANDGLICANCHASLNHIAPLFSKFDSTGAYGRQRLPGHDADPRRASTILPTGCRRARRRLAANEASADHCTADPALFRCDLREWAMSRGDVVNEGPS